MGRDANAWRGDLDDMAKEIAREIVDEMVDAVIDVAVDKDGLVWGQIKLPRIERVMKGLDDMDRGLIDEMMTHPATRPEGIRRLREFKRDAEAEGLIPEAQNVRTAEVP